MVEVSGLGPTLDECVEYKKDNTDPATLGQAILDTKRLYPHLTTSQIADGQTGVTMTHAHPSVNGNSSN